MTLVELKGQSMLLLRMAITISYMYVSISAAQMKNYKIVIAVHFKKKKKLSKVNFQ